MAPPRPRDRQSDGAALRASDATGESTAGNFVADAQLNDTLTEGAVAGVQNPGGVRVDDAGPVTYGEAFTMQPFGNNLTTITLTGAQLVRDAQAAVVSA